jgi:hypothetical protein
MSHCEVYRILDPKAILPNPAIQMSAELCCRLPFQAHLQAGLLKRKLMYTTNGWRWSS